MVEFPLIFFSSVELNEWTLASKKMAASSSTSAASNASYIETFDFPFCAEVSKYEKLAKIGQGTFGEVFKARDKRNKNKIVALKKVGLAFLELSVGRLFSNLLC